MKQLGIVFAAAGGVLAAIGLFWGVVIGFYPSEVPGLLATLGAGALLLFIGSKMLASTKPTSVEWSPAAPPSTSSPLTGSVSPPAAETVAVAVDPAIAHEPEPEPATTEQIDDATVAVPRRRQRERWSIELPDGTTALVREKMLLGRAPSLTAETSGADLVVVDDPSVSKSHALLKLVDGGLQVLDLESANGTVMIVSDVEHPCLAGVWMLVPDGATLELGTAEVRCTLATKREVAP